MEAAYTAINRCVTKGKHGLHTVEQDSAVRRKMPGVIFRKTGAPGDQGVRGNKLDTQT